MLRPALMIDFIQAYSAIAIYINIKCKGITVKTPYSNVAHVIDTTISIELSIP